MSSPMQQLIVNQQLVERAWPSRTVLLDVLRRELGLSGTKEGCREGDCGACAVLLGDRQGEAVRYRAVCSCLLPVGDAQGRHVVTIEGLNGPDLSPVQLALVEAGAIQCGFCTPGLVVALTAYLLETPALDPATALASLSGNLCRCTGYAGFRRAVERLAATLPAIGVPGAERIARLVEAGVLPGYFSAVAGRLASMDAGEDGPGLATGKTLYVGGGTDLFAQKSPRIEGANLRFLLREERLRGIARRGERLSIGAATTAAELMESPELASTFPGWRRYLESFASPLIRSRATVAGNLVNASPIGDLAVMLLALGATLVLEAAGEPRTLAVEDLFLGYKQLALRDGELIVRVEIPLPAERARFHFEKVSRRRLLDIASVNSAISLTEQDGAITAARLSAGGVAPVPLLLRRASACLVGRPIGEAAVRAAAAEARAEIAPIGDVRGSAAYKGLLLERLLHAHFQSLFPERMDTAQAEAR